jgi:hypothetical protein
MPFQIKTSEDELLFRVYTGHRDNVRSVMGHGVYPNLVKALETYAAFDEALEDELSDPDLLIYHAGLMQTVAPYVEQLRQLATRMVQIMEAIETAQPGVFGIYLPGQPKEPK